MEAFIEYFRQYRILFIILFVLLVVLIVVYSKMGKTMAKRKAEKEKLIKKLDHMKKIREDYASLTEEKILSDDGENLIEGIADNIQVRLEKTDDMNMSFEMLSEEEKTVYAFHYFLEEAKGKPSVFFKEFTKPLTPIALSACERFVRKDVFADIKELYDSYDEDNETASVIAEKINALDEKITGADFIQNAKENAVKFIKENVTCFIAEN